MLLKKSQQQQRGGREKTFYVQKEFLVKLPNLELTLLSCFKKTGQGNLVDRFEMQNLDMRIFSASFQFRSHNYDNKHRLDVFSVLILVIKHITTNTDWMYSLCL